MKKSLMDMAQQGGQDEAGEPQAEESVETTDQETGEEPDDKAGDAGGFQRPDISKFVPPEVKDVVDRVVAAGTKLMYSPELRQELSDAVNSDEPTPKMLAENITGLMLTLDQKSKGGIPMPAIFPAAMELLGEGCEFLNEAGREVTQDDYNTAAMMMYGMIGQKLGGSQDELMGAAAESMQGQNPAPDEAEQQPAQAAPATNTPAMAPTQ